MLLAGSLACKSKASCGQVLAGKKASARIWSKTVRFLCCRIKNLSAGWPPSCCQVLAALQKQGKARKSKESKARTPRQSQRGPGCTGNRARMHRQSPARKSQARIPRQKAQPQQEARKAWQSHRGWPGSSGKRPLHNAEGQEAPAKPPRGGPRKHRQSHPGGPGSTSKPTGGARNHRQVPGFRVCTFVIATSVRVITCRVKQLWRPSVSA